MLNLFKRKISMEDFAYKLYEQTRNISLQLTDNRDALITLGCGDVKSSIVELNSFQYIMYRTNLILWTKIEDEIFYGEIRDSYQNLCKKFIDEFLYYHSEDPSLDKHGMTKLFFEFDKILKDHYPDRLKIINNQMNYLCYFMKGSYPTNDEKAYFLSLGIEVENRMLDLVNSLIEKL